MLNGFTTVERYSATEAIAERFTEWDDGEPDPRWAGNPGAQPQHYSRNLTHNSPLRTLAKKGQDETMSRAFDSIFEGMEFEFCDANGKPSANEHIDLIRLSASDDWPRSDDDQVEHENSGHFVPGHVDISFHASSVKLTPNSEPIEFPAPVYFSVQLECTDSGIFGNAKVWSGIKGEGPHGSKNSEQGFGGTIEPSTSDRTQPRVTQVRTRLMSSVLQLDEAVQAGARSNVKDRLRALVTESVESTHSA